MKTKRKKCITIIAIVLLLVICICCIHHFVEKKKEIIPHGVYSLYVDGEIRQTGYEYTWRIHSDAGFLYEDDFSINISENGDDYVVGEFDSNIESDSEWNKFDFKYDKETRILSVYLPKSIYSNYMSLSSYDSDYLWVDYKRKSNY